jgi:ABC-type polysaccharide/polyol phosphate transport system ATPase subunit
MSNTVITVENLSKRYLIGHQSAQRARYSTLRDTIVREGRTFLRKANDGIRGRQIVQGDEVEEFWALKNVSFEVKRGEILGVIGRNGAGKSTLLKILSRVTEPTEGRVVLNGRVACLLEVGTGFHPELSGRENIFLNGAILGMSQHEIRRKLDAIVAFAEVERFIDTPVKRYSSGMYVRLAFSVAAHLEPEILVVDEVLAVGDAEFQKKCLGKMEEVSHRQGRTVLFVSHNLATVSDVANNGVLLDSGNAIAIGPINEVISTYLSRGSDRAVYVARSDAKPSRPHVKRLEVLTSEQNSIQQFGKRLTVKIWIDHTHPMSKACFSLNIINQFQHSVVHAWAFSPEHSYGSKPGETVLTCTFPCLRLNIGRYYIRTHLAEPPGIEHYETLDGLCPFEIVRTADTILWGWHPDHCVYHEDWNWTIGPIRSGPFCGAPSILESSMDRT